MSTSLVLSVREGVTLAPQTDGELVWQDAQARITFKHVSPVVRAAMEQLTGAGVREDRLIDMVAKGGGADDLSRLYYYLQRLAQRGILLRSAQLDGKRLATLTPISGSFVFDARQVSPACNYVISRFSYIHRVDDEMVVESPLSHARITLHDPRTMALVHLLAKPCSLADVVRQIPGLTNDAADQLVTLLVGGGLAQELDDSDSAAEDNDSALQVWEFHDLLFHARSRSGRHDNPMGATFRFVGRLEPPPALKPLAGNEVVELYRPDLERLQREDPPFAHIQETRRSIRAYGDPPINAKQLGEFLFRVGRVKEYTEYDMETPNGLLRTDFASRPYPGGGALYELELYIVVNSAADLGAGMYHYDPLRASAGENWPAAHPK